jgi:hypothetical protein
MNTNKRTNIKTNKATKASQESKADTKRRLNAESQRKRRQRLKEAKRNVDTFDMPTRAPPLNEVERPREKVADEDAIRERLIDLAYETGLDTTTTKVVNARAAERTRQTYQISKIEADLASRKARLLTLNFSVPQETEVLELPATMAASKSLNARLYREAFVPPSSDEEEDSEGEPEVSLVPASLVPEPLVLPLPDEEEDEERDEESEMIDAELAARFAALETAKRLPMV